METLETFSSHLLNSIASSKTPTFCQNNQKQPTLKN